MKWRTEERAREPESSSLGVRFPERRIDPDRSPIPSTTSIAPKDNSIVNLELPLLVLPPMTGSALVTTKTQER